MNRGRALRLVVGLAVLTAVGLLASSALATSRSTEQSLPTLNQQIFAAINAFRTSHGLVALRDSKALDRAALVHSTEMGQRGYFSHNSADGTSFFARVKRYYRAKGYSHWTVGENLLWGSPTVTAAMAMKQWIASPGHLKNLKTAKWRDLGVSAVSVAAAPAYYQGRQVTIITTDFGARG